MRPIASRSSASTGWRVDDLVAMWRASFARNRGARAFYERNGFVAIAHGFEPAWRLDDVKYQWVRANEKGPRVDA